VVQPAQAGSKALCDVCCHSKKRQKPLMQCARIGPLARAFAAQATADRLLVPALAPKHAHPLAKSSQPSQWQ